MKIILYISVLFLSGLAYGQVSEEAASTVTEQIDALMSDYTDTLVTPTEGNDGVVVISMKVLQSKEIAELWTFIAAAAIGKYFNDHPQLSVKEIWFSNVADMKTKPIRYSVLQLAVAKEVQSKVYNGAMEIKEAQAKIMNSLDRRTKEVK